jgi:two-component system invasion response regulator UvrY
MDDKIRVLIADDHAVVRQGLIQIISKTNDIVIVDEAENGNEVLKKVQTIEIDVLVVDFDMPEKSGLDVLLELKIVRPKLPVIILSIYSEERFGTRFLKAGASGYLNKTSAPQQLVEAIRRVARGGKFISPNLAEQLANEIGKNSEGLMHETLSDREFQVFFMIVSGKPIKSIADELTISPTTVSSHRSHILEKMNMSNNVDLVVYATKHGLIS